MYFWFYLTQLENSYFVEHFPVTAFCIWKYLLHKLYRMLASPKFVFFYLEILNKMLNWLQIVNFIFSWIIENEGFSIFSSNAVILVILRNLLPVFSKDKLKPYQNAALNIYEKSLSLIMHQLLQNKSWSNRRKLGSNVFCFTRR